MSYLRSFKEPNGDIIETVNVYRCDITGIEIINGYDFFRYGDNIHISEEGMEKIIEDYVEYFGWRYSCQYPSVVEWLYLRFCKKIKRNNFIPKKVKEYVLKKYKHTCNYCGSKDKLHIDHIYPVAKGGLTELKNLQVLCSKCNIKKSNKILPECQK